MPFDIEFIRNTLKAEGFHLESDGPLDSFYNFAVAIREHTIKELQGGPRPFIRLTEEDLKNCWGEPTSLNTQALITFARAIEDALAEKNK
jgi:hypothetical protein